MGPSICFFVPRIARWWFQIFFIFIPSLGRFPFWLFFKWVETTNQIGSDFLSQVSPFSKHILVQFLDIFWRLVRWCEKKPSGWQFSLLVWTNVDKKTVPPPCPRRTAKITTFSWNERRSSKRPHQAVFFGAYTPRKLTCPLKIDGWKIYSYWNGHFLGDMLVFRGVKCEFFTGWRLVGFCLEVSFFGHEEEICHPPFKNLTRFKVGPL